MMTPLRRHLFRTKGGIQPIYGGGFFYWTLPHSRLLENSAADALPPFGAQSNFEGIESSTS